MATYTATIKVGTRDNVPDLTRGFSRIDRDLDVAMFRGTEAAAIRLEGAIKSGLPFGVPGITGRDPRNPEHARESWGRMIEPTPHGGRAVVSSDNFISYLYWHGTEPHPIVAIRAKALRFFFRGHKRFFQNVWHPGTRPHPFVEEGGEVAEPGMKGEFDSEVDDIFTREDFRV